MTEAYDRDFDVRCRRGKTFHRKTHRLHIVVNFGVPIEPYERDVVVLVDVVLVVSRVHYLLLDAKVLWRVRAFFHRFWEGAVLLGGGIVLSEPHTN
uniref:Uncharacterized protein n=1 Tax=Anopheles atroparvus TaxID=41427 RepID=A0AAG5CPF4_ANOAO